MNKVSENKSKSYRVAIPLHGKMSVRTFHSTRIKQVLQEEALDPVYFLPEHYYQALSEKDREGYAELQSGKLTSLIGSSPGLIRSTLLRYIGISTESADLRFREYLENSLYNSKGIGLFWLHAAFLDCLRRMRFTAPACKAYEELFHRTHFHDEALKKMGIDCVLVPGAGNWAFLNEGFFAREAARIGLPVFAVITNYDNLINKGYRGITPKCLAVWSQLMADDAMRYHGLPASRIEITGPVQYDYFINNHPPPRDDFLLSKGLDPAKPTILYAATGNTLRLFEIYHTLTSDSVASLLKQCNLIIRAYPDPRVLSSPDWLEFRRVLKSMPGCYVSDPLAFEVDEMAKEVGKLDLQGDRDLGELAGLLKHSDVMINHYSTISLEAAILDLPTIHIGYDEYTYGRQYKQRSKFLMQMTHNKRPLRLAASFVATCREDLLRALEIYLGNRSLHREERRRYAELECGTLDGRSGVRLAQMVADRLPGTAPLRVRGQTGARK